MLVDEMMKAPPVRPKKEPVKEEEEEMCAWDEDHDPYILRRRREKEEAALRQKQEAHAALLHILSPQWAPPPPPPATIVCPKAERFSTHIVRHLEEVAENMVVRAPRRRTPSVLEPETGPYLVGWGPMVPFHLAVDEPHIKKAVDEGLAVEDQYFLVDKPRQTPTITNQTASPALTNAGNDNSDFITVKSAEDCRPVGPPPEWTADKEDDEVIKYSHGGHYGAPGEGRPAPLEGHQLLLWEMLVRDLDL